MPPNSGMFCKACGAELGHPEEELHDPESRYPVCQDMGIAPDNPDAHIVVQDGPNEDDFRLNCTREKKLTQIIQEPPEEPREDKGGSPTQPNEPQSQPPRRQGEVYDFDPDHTPSDLLEKVVTTESYGLSEVQIKEVKSWEEVFEGPIPPKELEKILGNLQGVSNQQAQLMGQKYEMMLSKWTREKSSSETGPQIGSRTAAHMMQGGSNGGGRPQPPSPNPPQQQSQGGAENNKETATPRKARKTKRERRVERRQEAMDEAIEEFSLQFAQNMADDAGTFLSEMRDIASTVMRKKAESDPEWFFEKAQEWDMDLFEEFMKASDAKKEEQDYTPEADSEVDEALNDILNEDPQPEEEQTAMEQKVENMVDEEMRMEEMEEPTGEEEMEDEELDSLLADLEGE